MHKFFLWIIVAALSLLSCQSGNRADSARVAEDEKFRPRFHFTPETNWMNDPNGLVYHQGVYHLFYQHYPDSNVWGPMHWGHATTTDLVHWEHQPIALYPDSLGMIFSGSAVADVNNTSGLGTEQNPALVAIYTYHQPEFEREGRDDYQYQGIAYSVDDGVTWKKYEHNPVLKNPGQKDFRDPKVFWYEPTEEWVMLLAVGDHIEFYNSPNLLEWKYASSFGDDYGAHGGVWECPDLFELEIEGTEEEKWVMLVSINPGAFNGGSGTQYFTGEFDGNHFTYNPQQEEVPWLDYGKDNYAGVTWNNIPHDDGRRIFIGWMSNWQYANVVPTFTWRSAMTFPRELNLVKTSAGLRLSSRPVRELSLIRAPDGSESSGDFMSATQKESEPVSLPSMQQEILLAVERSSMDKGFELVFSNTAGEELIIGLNGAANEFYIDRTKVGDHGFSDEFGGRHRGVRSSTSADVNLRILLDAASVEIFADEGTAVMTEIFFPRVPLNSMQLLAENGGIIVTSMKRNGLQAVQR